MQVRAVSVIVSVVITGCGSGLGGTAPPEREPGRTHAGLYDAWVGGEGQAGSGATAIGRDEERKPAGEAALRVVVRDGQSAAESEPEARAEPEATAEATAELEAAPEPEPVTGAAPPPRERAAVRQPAPRDEPRGMVSNVGEALPVRAEEDEGTAGEGSAVEGSAAEGSAAGGTAADGTVARGECVCPIESEWTLDPEVQRELQERARYRHPVGTATRVAGGPPDDFERPPGSAAQYGHAWPGGFDRAPGSADDLPAPPDTSP